MVEITLADGKTTIEIERVLRMASDQSREGGEKFRVWAESEGPGGETCHEVSSGCFVTLLGSMS